MPGYRWNYRLDEVVIVKKLPDLFSGLIPVQERHVAVDQDQIVLKLPYWLIFVFMEISLDNFDGFKTIEAMVTNFFRFDPNLIFKYNVKGVNIERLIVDYKYFATLSGYCLSKVFQIETLGGRIQGFLLNLWDILDVFWDVILTYQLSWFPFVMQSSIICLKNIIFRYVLAAIFIWATLLTVQFKLECENRALIWCRDKIYISIKLFYYRFGNYKSEANSTFVNLSCACDKSKELEQFVLVFIWYAYSCVNYLYFQVITISFVDNIYMDWDHTTSRELQSIRLKAKENLHDPLLIWANNWRSQIRILVSIKHIIFGNIIKFGKEIQLKLVCHFSLNAHHFFDRFPNIKSFDVLSKFACSDLSVIKKVLD